MFTDNIAAVLSYATPSLWEDGMDWYAKVNRMVTARQPDPWLGASVFAAFSPQTPWDRNVMLADTALRTGVAPIAGTLGMNIRACDRLLKGDDVFDVLKGLKTRAFADNIANAGISDVCTIDVHAYSICMGTPIVSKDMRLGKRVYAEMSEAYSILAEHHSVHVPQIQAIAWLTWREIHDVKARHRDVMEVAA